MKRQLISFFFVFVMIAVQAESFPRRRRRQATAILAPCPVRCSWTTSQAWSKAISFDTPSVNMLPNHILGGPNDTFAIMCSLYSQLRNCVRSCVVANTNEQPVYDALPSFEDVCINRQAEFDAAVPCVTNNAKLFQSVCQKENENLLAASVRLTTQSQQLDAKSPGEFCAAANKQLFCIFPIVRQTCGDSAYNLLRSIVNASQTSVRISIGEQAINNVFPDCGVYFNTVLNGIGGASVVSDNDTSTSTSTSASATTISYTSTGANIASINSTTTASIMRDDPSGGVFVSGLSGRLDGTVSPRFSTTTPSGATMIKLNHLLAFFSTSMLLYIFM